MTAFEMLFWLLVGHAVCDFPLQGDYLAKAKNRHQRGSAAVSNDLWVWCLSWHALIHAGAVALVTGHLHIALAELVLHWAIDFWKCEELYDFGVDQTLHIACKVAYLVALSV